MKKLIAFLVLFSMCQMPSIITAGDDVPWYYFAYKNRRKLRILNGGLHAWKQQEKRCNEGIECVKKFEEIFVTAEKMRSDNACHSEKFETNKALRTYNGDSFATSRSHGKVSDKEAAKQFSVDKIDEGAIRLGDIKEATDLLRSCLGAHISRSIGLERIDAARQELEGHIKEHEEKKEPLDRCYGYTQEDGTFKRRYCDGYLRGCCAVKNAITSDYDQKGQGRSSMVSAVVNYRYAQQQALPAITKEREELESRMAVLRRSWLSRWLCRK